MHWESAGLVWELHDTRRSESGVKCVMMKKLPRVLPYTFDAVKMPMLQFCSPGAFTGHSINQVLRGNRFTKPRFPDAKQYVRQRDACFAAIRIVQWRREFGMGNASADHPE